MKSIVVLLALLSYAFAQTNTVAMYAGTNNGTTWTPPTLSDSSIPPTCTPGSTVAYGAYFDYNVTVAGVFHVSVMTEGSFDSYVEVFAYSHPFDPTQPCTNVIIKDFNKELGGSGGPVIADFVYLAVGRYWFVVTANSADTVGQVAIHVYPPVSTGVTDSASPRWDSAYGAASCSGGTGTAGSPAFGLFTWTQATTGQFDLIAGWDNSSTSFSYVYLALYSGAQSAAAITADSCANYLYASYASDDGVTLWNITLTSGTTYTIATSPEYDGDFGHWGFWVTPTKAGVLQDVPGWTQPERSLPCTVSSSTGTSWFAEAVVAAGQVVIIDTQTLPYDQGFAYVDTYSWFFRGNQTLTTPPPTCGGSVITYGDTGDVTPVYGITIPGRIYTAVVSTYSSSSTVGNFGLFTYSGMPLGNIPPSDETTGVIGSSNIDTSVPSDGSDGTDTGNCDFDALLACGDEYSACASGVTTIEEVCECYLAFGACGACAGDCYSSTDIQTLIDSCNQVGCSGCDDFWTCGGSDGSDGADEDESEDEDDGSSAISVSIVMTASLAGFAQLF